YKNKSGKNSRNGFKEKNIVSKYGESTIQVPRDRESTFQPQVVKKGQKDVHGIEDKILSMYAKGLSTRQISESLRDIYGIDTSHETISNITDKILPFIRDWQNRPLEPIYPFVYFDALFVSVKEGHRTAKKAVYTAIGIDLSGRKDVLGIWISETESAHFWLTVLDELKGRGVQDICIACIDGLNGLAEAIEAIYPKARIQRCIVHLIGNATKYVSAKDRKAFCSDIKAIYGAATRREAEDAFEVLREHWIEKYPLAVRIWENNLDKVLCLYDFPREIRHIIYTTNAIESYHSSLRKVINTKA
ncbi:IS256 family transposase, partial [Thermotalea metallivorans]|uniref:IS256 family transposase n=1 Tax=Thermotalea metallivorans TaxID=520762 RepID=UPI000838117B